jgi:hypothetical protein
MLRQVAIAVNLDRLNIALPDRAGSGSAGIR